MMDEYIKRDDVLELIRADKCDRCERWGECVFCDVNETFHVIKLVPSADVENVRREAVVKFSERLKPLYKVLCVPEGFWYNELDNLVKEIVGEDNDG